MAAFSWKKLNEPLGVLELALVFQITAMPKSPMIPKTLFVLGAGASSGLGFPLGNQLKKELLNRLTDKGSQLLLALQSSGISAHKTEKFARQLERAEFNTIDQHLREIGNPETRMIGKRAVAYLIRMLENESALFHRDENPRHWYKFLADHFAQYPDHATPNQLTFITFNYDRSLPHYLFETLLNRNADVTKLKSFLGSENFWHIHGHVGELPWHFESGRDSRSYFQYGAQLSIDDMCKHKPDIYLPDDQADQKLMPVSRMTEAEIVVFVGYGFHDANNAKLPFGIGPVVTNPNRRFFNINPLPPPEKLLFEGKKITHLSGDAQKQIPHFLRDLASGELLNRNYAEPVKLWQ
ncbi:MAG TPA: hypothetical protein VG944_05575 [Fimbriimonas sp.]|nr:hypothetical protein [Fimbriimonas sp.]